MKAPKRRLPGIRATYSGGAWKWRAVWREAGRQRVGSLRATQEEAYDDYRAHVPVGHHGSQGVSLGEALERVASDAEERGIPPASVESYRAANRAICKGYWTAQSDLRQFSAQEIVWFINAAVKKGRAPRTIHGYLFHIHRAFQLAGLDSPVPEARRRCRTLLRPKRLSPPVLTRPEVEECLRRIREHPAGRDVLGRPRGLRSQGFDADVFELVAFTGVRAGELTRVRVRDVDLERMTIAVREPKDRGHPRVIPLHERLRGPLERLIAPRKPGEPLIPGGMARLNNAVKRWQERLGEPRWNLRQLRHSFATGLLESGATIAEVRDLLGHRTLSAVTTRYLHATDTGRAAAINRLAEHAAPHPPEEPASPDDRPGTPTNPSRGSGPSGQ